MDISKYTAFFHDGSLLDVKHQGNTIVLSMSSAEINKDDLQENIHLPKNKRIQGKLHIEKIKSININQQPFKDEFKMTYDDAEIAHFELKEGYVELEIFWTNYPPKDKVNDFNIIEIEAEKIWWETIPNLESFS